MKIRKVRLQNVKSYLDETITFNDGVNFISGINGAGKTTIIESIGYALFNSKPGNLGEFVRYGQRTGIITVELEGNDGRLYRVVRKFGGANSWLVFDMETDSEINLHGAVDIVPWLKEIEGIACDQDPSQLFDDIVGVNQGTFTAPFLERPSERKDKFNRIFGVEEYKEAFNKTREVVNRIDNEIRDLSINRAELEGAIKDYDELKQKTAELASELARLEEQHSVKNAELEKRTTELKLIKDRQKEIEKTSKDIQIKNEKIKSLEENLKKLKAELESANMSEGLVAAASAGYKSYIEIKGQLDTLEIRRKQRDDLKDRYSACQKEYAELDARIKTERNSIEAQRQDAASKRLKSQAEADAGKLSIKACKTKLEEEKELKKSADDIGDLLSRSERDCNEGMKTTVWVKTFLAKWSDTESEIEVNRKEIEREPGLIAENEKIKLLEAEAESLRGKKAALLQEIQTLKENLNRTVGGNCPFLGAPCLNVGEDLNAYFTKMIDEKSGQLSELERNEGRLEKDCIKAEKVRQDLFGIANRRDEIKRLEAAGNKNSEEFGAYVRKFPGLEIFNVLSQSERQLKDLHSKVFAVIGGENYNDLFEETDSGLKGLKGTWELFRELSCTDEPLKIITARESAEHLDNFCFKAEGTVSACKQLFRGLKAAVEKEYGIGLEALAKADRDGQNVEKQLREVESTLTRLQDSLKDLDNKNIRLLELAGENDRLKASLVDYEGIDSVIETLQEQLKNTQEAYDSYIRNLTQAQKVPSLKAELEMKSGSLEKEKLESSSLSEKLIEMKKDVTPEVVELAEKMVQNLIAELAGMKSLVQQNKNRLDEYLGRLEHMAKLKSEILKFSEEIEHYKSVRNMTNLIRNILNRAGERISAVYREYLANEANRIYREVSGENVTLEWRDDYEVFLVDMLNGRNRERCFRQLSGGEQMTAALAMRLGLLRQLSKVGVGFFDEPTTNLDVERRSNLAQIIPQVTGSFDQLFIISHDDSFDSMTENIVQLKKDSGDGTKLI